MIDTLRVAAQIALSDAAQHLLVGGLLSALQEAFLDASGNADGTYNLGDVLAWLDHCNSATPAGCVASAAEIERASAVLDSLRQDTAPDSLIRKGRLE